MTCQHGLDVQYYNTICQFINNIPMFFLSALCPYTWFDFSCYTFIAMNSPKEA